ncbi:MAG TPA: hypothetical protein VHZ74_10730 [Bryobacteraceae bacterium]|jgi:hypothetical protein|nr:hypothetical protein [Bryobacteraceae bacterium]
MAKRPPELAERPAMSQGVGESRPFIATDGVFENDLTNPRHLSNCTINGEPVPEHLWAMFPYEMTDQGYVEKNEGKTVAHTSIIRDETHGRIRQRGDDLDRGMGFEASDPMLELVRENVPPGMRPKFLSRDKVDSEGMTRGYQICMKNGNPVTLGTLVLGYMPEERAAAIQARFEEKSHDAQREMYGEDFDPRNPGRERVVNRTPKHEGDLSSSLRGRSFAHFENPGPEGPHPGDSDLGLQGDGEGF